MTAGESAASQAEPTSRTVPTARPVTTERIRIEQHTATGLLWFIGWLFTIGFLQLPFWKGVLGIVVWPYYLGSALTALLP